MNQLIAAALLAQSVWADIPAGAINGNVPNMEESCLMKQGTPLARTKDGVEVYDPGKVTYGSECPPGIPVPSIQR
jgi:hypothetical protein